MPQKPLALVLTQHFEPEPNFISQQVASELAKTHDVRVVTSHPHYPLGRFYAGTPWWKITKTHEAGAIVYRVPMFPDHSPSVVRRTLSYLSFTLVAAAVAPVIARGPRLVWIYHGPFVTGLAALLFKKVYGSRLILTCADLWPESFAAAGLAPDSLLVRAAMQFRRWFNRQMDHIVCATAGTLETFRLEGIPTHRLSHIPVWVPLPSASTQTPTRAFDIVYAGNIGPAQGLATAVRGCIALCRSNPGLRIAFAGTGSELDSLRALAQEAPQGSITFLNRVAPQEARTLCESARLQIISLSDTPALRHTLPSKLGFSLAAGAPIAFSAPGDTARILRSLPGTFEFTIGDPLSFATAASEALALSAEQRAAIASQLVKTYNEMYSEHAGLIAYRSMFLAHGGA